METDSTDTNQDDNQAPTMERLLDIVGDGKQLARIVKRGLALLIAALALIALVLIFRLGQVIWPAWMIEYRSPIMGVVLLALIVLILSSPLMIHITSHTRTLDGPGESPGLE